MRRRTILAALTVAAWASSVAAAEPPKVGVALVGEGLAAPIQVVEAPGGAGPLLVLDQLGTAHRLRPGGGVDETPFLDLRAAMPTLLKAFDERGLWTLAFHPRFADNGRLFVTYSAQRRPASPHTGSTAYTWRLSEFRLAADRGGVDAASERVLLELDWANRKHNGGGLVFGPDGFLYVGVGDGGGVHGVPEVYEPPPLAETDAAYRHAAMIKEDPYRIPEQFHGYDAWAQDLGRLEGKILRLDVDRAEPYRIPLTNPFRDGMYGRPEIWAWGFRNPFRLAFDRNGSGDLLVSATAETLWEAVYLVRGPGNYGWAVREGAHCFDRSRAFDPPASCPRFDALGERIHDPIVEYANWSVKRPWSKVGAEPGGTANVGAVVYRGTAVPALAGRVVLGDFSTRLEKPSGLLMLATPPATLGDLWSLSRLLELDQRLHSLGEDEAGELYLLTTASGMPIGRTGKVWKLVPE